MRQVVKLVGAITASFILAYTIVSLTSGTGWSHITARVMGHTDRICLHASSSESKPAQRLAVILSYMIWRIPERPEFGEHLCNLHITFSDSDFGELQPGLVKAGYFRDGTLFTDPHIYVSLVSGNPLFTLVHELGHAMGIDYGSGVIHSKDPRSVMFAVHWGDQVILPEDRMRMASARKQGY